MIIFKLLQKFEEFVLSVGILFMAGLTIVNVFSRTFLDSSLASVEELNQFLIIAVTFFGASYAAGKARHIRMSALYDELNHKGKKGLILFSSLLTMLLTWGLSFYALSYAQTLMVLGTRSPVLNVPFYWIYMLAPLGLFLTGLQYFLTLIKNLTTDEIYLSFDEPDHAAKRLPAEAEQSEREF